MGPSEYVQGFAVNDVHEDRLRRADTAFHQIELCTEDVDGAVGIEPACVRQGRRGITFLGGRQPFRRIDNRLRASGLMGLLVAQNEPGASRQRAHNAKATGDVHAEIVADPGPGESADEFGISVVIPNWNGLRWMPGCLDSLARQKLAPREVIVVDNGSSDGSAAYLRSEHPDVRLLELSRNTGFAHAANRGIEAARCEWVALVNTDVELAEDWLARMARAAGESSVGAVACKMLSLEQPEIIYDAGDILRRDGVCEQRGRFMRDDGRWDRPGEVFGACAGAALFRRSAVLGVRGFDEDFFAYLEDVDLALRLRLVGWKCRYEPAVALHGGEGSSDQLVGGAARLAARNTLLMVAKAWPARWLPLVAYRQLSSAWWAFRRRRLRSHLAGLASAVPHIPVALRQRRSLRKNAAVPIEEVIPPRPFRGRSAAGHPSHYDAQALNG
jgi:GT2 family glycosyltransferase